MIATTDQLLTYLADIIERAEMYGAIVLSSDGDESSWGRNEHDQLFMSLSIRPPDDPGSPPAELVLQEYWQPIGPDQWEYFEYKYELRDYALSYRRALHRHNIDFFVRAFGVATHEHCESQMGIEMCKHYAGTPINGGLDALDRLYNVWIEGIKPNCAALKCLG